MKIHIVTPQNSKSGVGAYCRNLSIGMKDMNACVFLEEGVEATSGQNEKSAHERSGSGQPVHRPLYVALGYVRELGRRIQYFRKIAASVDVLHVNAMGCEVDAVAARLAGIHKSIGTLHVMPGEDEWARKWVRRAVEWCSLRSVSRLIAISDAVADAWSKRARLPRSQFTVIYNGTYSPSATSVTGDGSSRASDGRMVVGFTGRLHPLKGTDILLKAFAALPTELRSRASLLIVGDGPCRPQLEELARSLGVETATRFAGHVDDVFPHLRTMDVFVSASRYEGMSLSVAEAMQCGLPCIVTDTGGMAELIEKSKGGLIVPVDDIQMLTAALAHYLANESCRVSDGGAAALFGAANFSLASMCEKTNSLYESLAHE